MKKIILSTIAITTIALLAFTQKKESYKTLEIGAKAPKTEVKMANTNGRTSNLEELAKENGTLVIFSCNTCPFVIQWEDRYPELAELAESNKIGMVLVNSNEAKRDGDDSMEKMIDHAEVAGYSDVPYLEDKKSALANAFGAKTTPHVFLFDKEWKLVYEGSIDDNSKDADAVTATYLKDALNNLKAGKKISPNNTKAIGCSIKRVKV